MKRCNVQSRQSKRGGGFALLITITLLSFLVLLLVSLAAFTKVETQVATNTQSLFQARQNALMGLNIALGQLQKYAGPDQRVTATAEALSATTPAANTPNNLKWTGVWGLSTLPTDALTPTAADAHAAAPTSQGVSVLLNWLVSGNESASIVTSTSTNSYGAITSTATVSFAPTAAIQGAVTTLSSNLQIGGSRAVLLVGPQTAGSNSSNYIVAPIVAIKAAGQTVGNYAYWVGDEGVKAKANIVDVNPAVGNSGAATVVDLLNNVDVGARTAFEMMQTTSVSANFLTDTSMLNPLTALELVSSSANQISKWIYPNQLGYLLPGSSAALAAMAQERFHDYTLWSYGVQSNVVKGGLKTDLTAAFEMDPYTYPVTSLSAELDLVKSAIGFNASDLAMKSPNAFALPTYNASSSAYGLTQAAAIFNRPISIGTVNAPGPVLRGPTWHMLRNYYRTYKQFALTGAALSIVAQAPYPGSQMGADLAGKIYTRGGYSDHGYDINTNDLIGLGGAPTPTPRLLSAGFAPYVNRAILAIGIGAARQVNNSPPEAVAARVVGLYEPRIYISPFVVLHNPYDVSIVLPSRGDGFSGSIGFWSLPIRVRLGINNSQTFDNLGNPGSLYGYLGADPAGTAWLNNLPINSTTIASEIAGTLDPMFATLKYGYYDAKGPGAVTPSTGTASGVDLDVYERNQGGHYNSQQNTYNLLVPVLTLAPGELRILSTAPAVSVPLATAAAAYPVLTMSDGVNFNSGFYLNNLNGALPNNTLTYTNPVTLSTSSQSVSANGVGPFAMITSPTGTSGNAFGGPTQPTQTIAGITGQAGPIWMRGDWNISFQINVDTGGNLWDSFVYQFESYSGETVAHFANAGSSVFSVSNDQYPFTDSDSTPGANLRSFQRGLAIDGNGNNKWRTAGGKNGVPIASLDVNTTGITYLFAADLYVKPNDMDSYDISALTGNGPNPLKRAARPFVTSNPLALSSVASARFAHTNLGFLNANNGGYFEVGVKGFPYIMPAYQREYVDLNGGNVGLHSVLLPNVGVQGPTGTVSNAFWGNSLRSASGQNTVPLIHVPTTPMTSLAQFQHLNMSLYGYQPYFAFGNSYASSYVPSYAVAYDADTTNGHSGHSWVMSDISYLSNAGLWDSAFFSTLAPGFNSVTGRFTVTTGTVVTNWLAGQAPLPNSRVKPYLSSSNAGTIATDVLEYHKAAANLLVEGTFNINSRSVNAWAAVLGAARNAALPTNYTGGTTPASGAAYVPRVQSPNAVGNAGTSAANASYWSGVAKLTDAQIKNLAVNIVTEITNRQKLLGRPFLSLAEFINRSLISTSPTAPALPAAPSPDPASKGALQAALDDYPTSPNAQITGSSTNSSEQTLWNFPYPNNGTGLLASAGTGFMLQADLLQQIGPFLSARSDTFVIRAYGEAVNSATAQTQARAWCEAVVQRVPDYVDQTDPALTAINANAGIALGNATAPSATTSTLNANLGRKYKIVAFRWLSPSDI